MARNLITDVAGLRVGHADDAGSARASPRSCSTSRRSRPADVRGGGPGTRETDLLDPATDGRADRRHRAVGRLGLRPRRRLRRAGLAARAGPRLRSPRRRACRSCRARSCSTCSTAATRTGAAIRPIASSAMRRPPHAAPDFALGSVGAGLGATTADLKGGLGSASATHARRHHRRRAGRRSMRSAASPSASGPHFWAAPFERDGEFGGRGLPASHPARGARVPHQGPAGRKHHASPWSRPTPR